MKIEANSVAEYLENIPDERKPAFNKLRETIIENIPSGFEECLNYGMIGYVVPHKLYPKGYHVTPDLPLPFCNIASQKNFIAFYHSGLYVVPEIQKWFTTTYAQVANYKLDMGKSCVRFKKMDDIPYDLIGELMTRISTERWISIYESNLK